MKWDILHVCRLLGQIAVLIRESPTNSREAINIFSVYKSLIRLKVKVEILITNNAFCIVQRATAQSTTGNVHGYGLAEAPPIFQAG
jgi:hypothetical protein